MCLYLHLRQCRQMNFGIHSLSSVNNKNNSNNLRLCSSCLFHMYTKELPYIFQLSITDTLCELELENVVFARWGFLCETEWERERAEKLEQLSGHIYRAWGNNPVSSNVSLSWLWLQATVTFSKATAAQTKYLIQCNSDVLEGGLKYDNLLVVVMTDI